MDDRTFHQQSSAFGIFLHSFRQRQVRSLGAGVGIRNHVNCGAKFHQSNTPIVVLLVSYRSPDTLFQIN